MSSWEAEWQRRFSLCLKEIKLNPVMWQCSCSKALMINANDQAIHLLPEPWKLRNLNWDRSKACRMEMFSQGDRSCTHKGFTNISSSRDQDTVLRLISSMPRNLKAEKKKLKLNCTTLGPRLFVSTYRFLGKVRFLQHHRLGLTEAIFRAFRALDSHLHSPLSCCAALWRLNHWWLLGSTLDIRDSVY